MFALAGAACGVAFAVIPGVAVERDERFQCLATLQATEGIDEQWPQFGGIEDGSLLRVAWNYKRDSRWDRSKPYAGTLRAHTQISLAHTRRLKSGSQSDDDDNPARAGASGVFEVLFCGFRGQRQAL